MLTVCVCDRLYVCARLYVRSQLGSLALFWVCKDFFVVSMGVSNCDKLLGSARAFVKPGVSLRNGAALRAD